VIVLASAAQAQRLHAILVADTLDKQIGKSVGNGLQEIKHTLRDGLGDRLSVIELTGNVVTPNKIKDTLLNIRIRGNDAVLLYYLGHGGCDQQYRHFFALNRGRLYRSEVVNSITQPLKPRFWAVISDCCASISQVTPAPIPVKAEQQTLFKHLFLDTSGSLNITSSRPEQVSLGCSSGGIFSSSFCEVLKRNSHKRLDWDDVFRMTRSETGKRSEEAFRTPGMKPIFYNGVKQQTQTPFSFQKMYRKEVNGLRLGIVHSQMVVACVYPNLPAWRAGIRRRMRIHTVNGFRVKNDSQLITAINFSPRKATIGISDGRGTRNVAVELAY
jgi:hypothetical protein